MASIFFTVMIILGSGLIELRDKCIKFFLTQFGFREVTRSVFLHYGGLTVMEE